MRDSAADGLERFEPRESVRNHKRGSVRLPIMDPATPNHGMPSYLDHVTEIRLDAEAAWAAVPVLFETTYCNQLR
jgi:hypothetical protein